MRMSEAAEAIEQQEEWKGENRRKLWKKYYEAYPRQKEFHESKKKYRLFGGAAGPGKTKALLWEAIKKAEDHDGCDTLLLRRTYPELESSPLAQSRGEVPRRASRGLNKATL